MQTFLPYADFRRSAAVLDNRRLGNQRVEAYVILRTLRGIRPGWKHHPVVHMWRGHEDALRAYLRACIDEWVRRGFRNSMRRPPERAWEPPPWLGDERLHASHRANLLRKDPAYYRKFGWREDPTASYWWPVQA